MSRIYIHDEKNRIWVENLIIAESSSALMKGLLGRKTLAFDCGMLLRPCRSIHMWFMHFSIDVAFLDSELRVLKVVPNLRPWALSFGPRKATAVLETAAGKLAQLEIGTRLELKTEPT